MPDPNLFWDFSLRLYKRPGVEPLCLRWQDDWGADVNLLLFAAWLAQSGKALDAEHWHELDNHVSSWRNSVLRPVRMARRALNDFPDRASVRQELLNIELALEKQEQDMLVDYLSHVTCNHDGEQELKANLAALARLWKLSDEEISSAQAVLADALNSLAADPAVG